MPDPFWFKNGQVDARQIGYTASGPLNLTILPAGHAPGLYLILSTVNVRTPASAGSINVSVTSAERYGGNAVSMVLVAAQTIANGASTFRGVQRIVTNVESNGTTPVVLAITVSGVTGSPLIDVTGHSVFMGS